uniref:Uncharacterized protein n=1 Tax=Fusarium oxysporum (strain Fo5176) TaxID=660025 RepID=A0A0D2YD86_FUSOF
MFHRMGCTGDIRLVAEVSHIDIQRSAGLVRFEIMHPERFRFIVKTNDAIISVVERRFLERVGNKHHHRNAVCWRGGLFFMFCVRHSRVRSVEKRFLDVCLWDERCKQKN